MTDVPGDDRVLLELLGVARDRGFLGPGDVAFHVEHAELFCSLVDPSHRVLDLGSGGGLPGLVLLARRPGLALTMLDSNERRTTFLSEALRRLGAAAENATVVRARAEAAGRSDSLRGRFDVAVSRSFGSPAVTAECAAPFLVVGGRLLVSEPPSSEAPGTSRWDSASLSLLGLGVVEVVERGGSRVAVLSQRSACPPSFPRRVGQAAKRPLF